jgi:hypothetical protein
MKFSQKKSVFTQLLVPCMGLIMLVLTGCSSDSNQTTGYIKFYNASPNAPGVFLTVDENLDDDDDDEIEVTYSAIDYTEVSGNNLLDTNTY